jgi:hypothetical protein
MIRLLAYLEVPRLYPGYALSLKVFALRRNVEILAEGLPVSVSCAMGRCYSSNIVHFMAELDWPVTKRKIMRPNTVCTTCEKQSAISEATSWPLGFVWLPLGAGAGSKHSPFAVCP